MYGDIEIGWPDGIVDPEIGSETASDDTEQYDWFITFVQMDGFGSLSDLVVGLLRSRAVDGSVSTPFLEWFDLKNQYV